MRWKSSTVDATAPELESLERASVLRRIPPRNPTKADIVVLRHAGRTLAVKSYARRPFFVRNVIGRFLIRREAAVYRTAGEIPGLCRFAGRLGAHALATEWVDARPLATLAPGQVPESCFDRLDEIVAALHRRGIALCDLHHRDVLIDERGEVFVVDLALGFIDGAGFRRRVFAWLCAQDRVAAARMRARFLGGDEQAAIERVGTAAARRWALGRRLKRALSRLR